MPKNEFTEQFSKNQSFSLSQTTIIQSSINYIKQTALASLSRKTLGGLLLMLATILALVLANSPLAGSYHHILEDELVIGIDGHFSFGLTLEEWINDGLMAIFFLVAGLELKREVLFGELSSTRKAALPLVAALGGMLVPALIYISLNAGNNYANGWGIPMATDIAYSLGIIRLLGKRVPTELKVFLVALAIADDLGAILVIAIFYSHSISWLYLGFAAIFLIVLMLLNRIGVKHLAIYLIFGIALWYCFLYSGIHPTIAGVLFALCIPVKPALDSQVLKKRVAQNIQKLEQTELKNYGPMADKDQRKILKKIEKDTQQSRPPLLKLENSLSGFNAFFILPIFALANAGVALNISLTEVFTNSLGLGIILGLFVGKVTGISLFSYIAHRMGWAKKSASMSWLQIMGIGMIAGMGFTMSLFITNLAIDQKEALHIAKLSILIASSLAALLGVILLLWSHSNLQKKSKSD